MPIFFLNLKIVSSLSWNQDTKPLLNLETSLVRLKLIYGQDFFPANKILLQKLQSILIAQPLK